MWLLLTKLAIQIITIQSQNLAMMIDILFFIYIYLVKWHKILVHFVSEYKKMTGTHIPKIKSWLNYKL
jgi:hypothetical protein